MRVMYKDGKVLRINCILGIFPTFVDFLNYYLSWQHFTFLLFYCATGHLFFATPIRDCIIIPVCALQNLRTNCTEECFVCLQLATSLPSQGLQSHCRNIHRSKEYHLWLKSRHVWQSRSSREWRYRLRNQNGTCSNGEVYGHA